MRLRFTLNSAGRLVLVLLVCVFAGEFLVHNFIERLLGASRWVPLLDAVTLLALFYPVVTRLVVRPLLFEIGLRKRAEEQFRQIFEASPNVIFTVDSATGRITLVNGQVEAVFGYRPEELIGKEIDVLVPERFRSTHHEQMLKYLQAPTKRELGKRRDLLGLRKDGREIPVEIALTPVHAELGVAILATVVDITIRKQFEEYQERTRKAQEELSSIVSHELKNPLSVVVSGLQAARVFLVQVCQDQTARGKIERQLLLMTQAAERMKKITIDLLDVARVETGKFSVSIRPASISEIVAESLNQVQSSAQERKIRLESTTAPDLQTVSCDRDRIIQVLSNLIGNAIKFSREGSTVRITVTKSAIEGASVPAVAFQVNDTGPGISPEDLSRIFQRFWQSDHNKETGTGLGLFISKSIIQSHHGTISVQSEVGKGSTFTVALPLGGSS